MGRLYESSRSVSNGWRFTARRKCRLPRMLAASAPLDSKSLSGLSVLIICNSAAKEIGSEKRPLFLKLSNWLFNLIAARSRFSYKTQLFFNNSENHIKSSLRTRLQKAFKNISKTPENWKSLVFFKTLENSKTSVKTNRILTFSLLVKIHLEKSNFIFVARLRWEGCAP